MGSSILVGGAKGPPQSPPVQPTLAPAGEPPADGPSQQGPERSNSDAPPISGTVGVRARGTSVPTTVFLDERAAPVIPTAAPEPARSPLRVRSPEQGEAPSSRLIDTDVPAELADPAVPKVVAQKPLLASEALMEDLAPVEPARRGARAWCAGVGGASLLFGALPLVGLLPGGTPAAIPWLVTGAIALVAGLTPVTYRQRAVAMVVLGLLEGVVALQGAGGALMRADGGTWWGLARLFAAVALPAALLFRARYRAYAGARVFLGAALAVSLPFAVHTVLSLFGAGGVAQAGGVAVLFVLAGSLAGFMGAETTGAGTYMAPATVIALTAELALRGVGRGPLLGVGTGAVAFGGAAALASLGVFQILAWRFAADARRIDLHVPRRDSSAPTDADAASDWSTRD